MFNATTFQTIRSLIYISLVLVLTLAFQNCGPTEVKMEGGMEQQLSIAPETAEQVESIFQSVFGRIPSSTELSQYMTALSSGITEAQLRSQLARSAEAQANLTAALQQKFGSVNPLLLSSYTSLLSSSFAYSDLLGLIKSR